MKEKEEEKVFPKVRLNWDNMANAKHILKPLKNKAFFILSFFAIWLNLI